MELSELDKLLDEAKPPSTEEQLCLRGDLQLEWERLSKELQDLLVQNQSGTQMLAGNSGTAEAGTLAASIKELERQMAGSAFTVRLEAMPRLEFDALKKAHPPREGNDEDAALRLNEATFFPALIGACMVEPALDAERLSRLLDKLTSYQYDKLTNSAWALNRQDVSVPFSLTASLITATSGGTSKPQSGSGSRTAGSRAGSRKKSPTTATTTLAG